MIVGDKVKVDTWIDGKKGRGRHIIGLGTIKKKRGRYYEVWMKDDALLCVLRKDCKSTV